MKRIPVSIVTGFLGVGKTTFLNRLLSTGELDRAALVVNEFGDIGIDHLLIETADEGIVELSGGCLCCSLRGDLANTLMRLVERSPSPDRIVIETTGLANPGPIAQTVIAHPGLNSRLELAGIATLIDAANGPEIIAAHEEARCQITLADNILITKSDVKRRAPELDELLADLNQAAQVVDLVSITKPSLELLNSALPTTKIIPSLLRGHAHKSNISAVGLTSKLPIAMGTIELFFDTLCNRYGDDLLRVKGFVGTADLSDRPMLIQAVGQNFDTPQRLPIWPDNDVSTRLVVIGRNLDEEAIRRLFHSLANTPQTDTPDRQALIESPLSVPGFSMT